MYRHGKTVDGYQRYRCTACRRTFQLRYRHIVQESGTRQQITTMALNGSGIRDTVRVLSVSPQIVMGGVEKRTGVVNQRPLVRTVPPAASKANLRLCADEMWSFVRHKKGQRLR